MTGSAFRLAHLTDLHVPPLPMISARSLMSRRVLGWVSWKRRRHRTHRREVLDALAEDVLLQAPDHVAVTGDLVNLALPLEFVQGARWLSGLGDTSQVTFVPGNHDAYVSPRWLGSWANVGPYMRGDGDNHSEDQHATFPFVRRRGPLALIGVSTAVPNPPTLATGKIGSRQRRRLRECLHDLRGMDCCRVVLIHHPPTVYMTGWRRRLVDAHAFRAVLREAGAELVLCGHQHRFQFAQLEGADGRIPVVGGPSASLLTESGDRYGGYLLHTIGRGQNGWTIRVEGRRYDASLGRARHDFTQTVTRDPVRGTLSLVGDPAPEATGEPVRHPL
jgi:3',5'-cyclic AMP phosphodiesterase CpdA